jgi:hypothetical protein
MSVGLIALSLLASAATAAGARASSVSRVVVYRYRISYAVTATEDGVAPIGMAGSRVWSDRQDWSSSWSSVPITVSRTASGKPVSLAGQDERGTTSASESFSYTDPPSVPESTSCTGAVPTHTYGAWVAIANDGLNAITPAGEAFDDAVEAEVRSACLPNPSEYQKAWPATRALTGPGGLLFGVSPEGLYLEWPGVPIRRFPFSAIAGGRSFTLESGNQTTPLGTTSTTEAVTIKFKFLGSGKRGVDGWGRHHG